MAFPVDLTVTLTGATTAQLSSWRGGKTPLLVPEVARRPRALYSFRDLVALRTVVYLRSEIPLQRVRKAFQALQEMDLTDHPSRYQLWTDGVSVFLLLDEDISMDLVHRRGQQMLAGLGDVFAPFRNFRDQEVVDFLHPRHRLEVRERRLGGWPTVAGTRVPFDVVADLVTDGDVSPEEVSDFYPTVSPADVPDAVSFAEQVRSAR
ncbi:DUF433 domain-containing protein [Gordonia sp. WA4-43]|uniref:DUF433 domain-containing protein n=1 Tax=Gordonia sp. WA4-43 TaxID=2878678 RepID=UPI001CFB8EB3|nr:DUF433 domain-containing protein [Gordonia sp. WA4-43]UCZ89848.1 DUF433 domain-containing protein [Gordonia sp. WA4-43]